MAEEWIGSYCVERWFGARGVREKLALQEGSVYPMRWYLIGVGHTLVRMLVWRDPGHSQARRPALGGGCSSYPEGERHWAVVESVSESKWSGEEDAI